MTDSDELRTPSRNIRRRKGRASTPVRTGPEQLPWGQPQYLDAPIEPLDAQGVADIHDAAMRILEEIGIDFLHNGARQILQQAG